MTGLEMTFAPLIVQEVDDRSQTDPSPFGAIVSANEVPRVDPTRSTLYTGTFTTRIHSIDHEQVVYFWRYPHRVDEPEKASLEGRGVRITLGSDGSPLVWEALSTNSNTRVFFVSEGLELAAVREFGGPLPGRRYAVEPALDETQNVVIARVLDDGPVPMGPYVYLNAPPKREVTTVLCRCMPSQADEFVETLGYDLAPLESIRDWGDTRSCIDPPPPRVYWGGTLSYWNLKIPWEETPLERILRWPKKF